MWARRLFLKMTGSAAIAFAVGVEHFHPVRAGVDIELDGRELDIDVDESRYSPVVQGLRKWNDLRHETFRELQAAGFSEHEAMRTFWESPQVAFTIRSNKLQGRAVAAQEIAQREFNEKIKRG
jgi:hypothetical protein